MWDILLATIEETKALAIMKSVRLQAEYFGMQKTKIAVYVVLLYIEKYYLGISLHSMDKLVRRKG